MRIHTSDKVIAWLTLFSGLTISAVAIYYSVAGLTAIFAAAVIPIIVMGIALEISKLAATVWLKQNWNRAPNFIRGYLLAAIAILMFITSMGIFGFLSKAHSDQSLVSGDVQSKIAVYDEKIRTAKDNIDANRKALKQMDEAVDQVMGRSTDEKGADKAVALRRSQAKERTRLLSEITAEQKIIAQLSEERAPIAAEIRKVEAEVGPIKYIAKFIYGDNPDANILEKAVTWVIIIIVIVFDPLAVILLLASQYSFNWFRQQQEETEEMASDLYELEKINKDDLSEPVDTENVPGPWPFPVGVGIRSENKNDDFKFLADDKDLYPEGKTWEHSEKDSKFDEKKPLEEWNEMIAEAEKALDEENEKEEQEILDSVPHTEKEAMAAWKHDNPDDSLKRQKKLLEKGVITELPWLKYLQPKADFTEEQEAALEAAKWAQEQMEAKQEISWMEHDEEGNQIKKTKEGYTQNAEQSERTIWQRIQDAKK